ncbi:MAG: hypothetical protein ABR978_06900, partial [Dehalococcoidia bacterium]
PTAIRVTTAVTITRAKMRPYSAVVCPLSLGDGAEVLVAMKLRIGFSLVFLNSVSVMNTSLPRFGL